MLHKKIIGLLLIGLLLFATTPAYASVHVNGYFRKDTYVQPHYRSNPDGNFNNNWSTKGNINPYTGQKGTKTSPNYSDTSGINIEVPVPAPPPKISVNLQPLQEEQKKANDQFKQLQEEQKKANDQELEKQRRESEKQLDEAIKELNEVGKNYRPYVSQTDTENTQSSNQTDSQTDTENTQDVTLTGSNVESVAANKKKVNSKSSFWEKFKNFITGLFS
jgi:hypothetical protein